MIVFFALSSLALLAAIACFVLLICEKKRNKKRNAALMQYIDELVDDTRLDNSCYMQGVKDELANLVNNLQTRVESFETRSGSVELRVESLEKGIVPDFEKSKEAADAVNSFNAGITGILGFDPHDVLKKQRNNNSGGDID